jgi:hypothetical protein
MTNNNKPDLSLLNSVPKIELARITIISYSSGHPMDINSTADPHFSLHMLAGAVRAISDVAFAPKLKTDPDDEKALKKKKFLGPRQ